MRARPILIVIALCAALVACGTGTQPTGSAGNRCEADAPVSLGQPLPSCTFDLLDGGTIALADLRGTPAVLNFWASWCVACISEMPDFDAVATALEGRVRFVGMNALGVDGETEAAARTFAERTGVTYTLAFDDGGGLYGHFGTPLHPVLPLTILVDAGGVVRGRHFGELSRERLRELIDEGLGVT